MIALGGTVAATVEVGPNIVLLGSALIVAIPGIIAALFSRSAKSQANDNHSATTDVSAQVTAMQTDIESMKIEIGRHGAALRTIVSQTSNGGTS